MKHKFDPLRPLVIARTKIVGPAGETMVQLAVDTGASASLIAWHALNLVGYQKDDAVEYTQMTTGSGVEKVPRIKVKRIEALGKKRPNLTVVGHTLPPSADVDGLLGLDFFRGSRLTIDFRKSVVSLD